MRRPKKFKKTQDGHENQWKNDENDQALVSNEMTLSSIGNDIFIGDSAVTSHMTNNKTGVYDLIPNRGSVMIGNGESISCTHNCTHKGKLDVICKHKDGSTAKQTWEVKIVEFNVSVIVSFEVIMMHNKHQLLLSCHSIYLLPDGFAIQKVLTRAGVRELVVDVF